MRVSSVIIYVNCARSGADKPIGRKLDSRCRTGYCVRRQRKAIPYGTPEEQGDEYLLMGLRLAEGVDPDRYRALSGRELNRERLARLIEDGFPRARSRGPHSGDVRRRAAARLGGCGPCHSGAQSLCGNQIIFPK